MLTIAAVMILGCAGRSQSADDDGLADNTSDRPRVAIRGIYGGVPTQILERGKRLDDFGVNAIWIGAGGISSNLVAEWKRKAPGLKIFAEFNTMHEVGYLRDHPDAFPVDADGKIAAAPDGWQGVCPTHPGYRRERMTAFRQTLRSAPIDGIWLDYHHAHASWEQPRPNLPDTCFCTRCRAEFQRKTGIAILAAVGANPASLRPAEREAWVRWRCDVFTDWVREFREIVNQERPGALLGTFHCPWSESDHDNAIREKLAIDLKAQAHYIDVFSIMPYHARFGHAADPAWISRQTAALGRLLGVKGEPGERLKIWPIVQLSDWGESVAPAQIATILDHGTRPPATGVMVFVWGTLYPQWEKVEAMGTFYRAIRDGSGGQSSRGPKR